MFFQSGIVRVIFKNDPGDWATDGAKTMFNKVGIQFEQFKPSSMGFSIRLNHAVPVCNAPISPEGDHFSKEHFL